MINHLTKGQQYLLQGQQLRELGKTFEGMNMLNLAIEEYMAEKNYIGVVRALLDRAFCWQHLYHFSGNDMAYATLYKSDAEASLEIATSHQIQEVMPGVYFMNGKVQSIFGNYKSAIEYFEKGLALLPENKRVQKGDWETNLGKAVYRSGDKEKGLDLMKDGIKQIIEFKSEVDKHSAAVWLSGGYIRLSEVLQEDDPEASKKYAQLAAEVIASGSDLNVRQRQLENYLKTGSSGL